VNPFDLTGRIALVTGAGSGLGRAFALGLAAAGASVALAGRRREALEETAALLKQSGARCMVVTLDVADDASIEAALDRVQAGLGVVDVLVNNAGMNRAQPAVTMSTADWDTIVGTNLRGVFLLARGVGQRLIAAKKTGSIVNISSLLALRTQKGTAAYGAAKAGVLQLTRVLALEWARHGIRVNAIVPGYFRTEIVADFIDTPEGQAAIKRIPARRVGLAAELVPPLLLLASDAGAYINGTELVVDGGLSCASP
jgi:NAD(P)-dependent dehydrogenase (short-subunit alcohol dehydrogenase family)